MYVCINVCMYASRLERFLTSHIAAYAAGYNVTSLGVVWKRHGYCEVGAGGASGQFRLICLTCYKVYRVLHWTRSLKNVERRFRCIDNCHGEDDNRHFFCESVGSFRLFPRILTGRLTFYPLSSHVKIRDPESVPGSIPELNK